MSRNKLSIIIPVLNESAVIEALIKRVRTVAENAELIVVDGLSYDQTPDIAVQLADKFLQTGPGRAVQMNAGADLASGDYLLFLHADTQLPENFSALFSDWVKSTPVWGHFTVRLSGPQRIFRVIEAMINLRTYITQGATGDQCLIYRADQFRAQSGFPELPLMEDVAMSRKMRRLARAKIFPESVITSSRRWEQSGVLRTVLMMWKFRLLYMLGVSPSRFANQYSHRR